MKRARKKETRFSLEMFHVHCKQSFRIAFRLDNKRKRRPNQSGDFKVQNAESSLCYEISLFKQFPTALLFLPREKKARGERERERERERESNVFVATDV